MSAHRSIAPLAFAFALAAAAAPALADRPEDMSFDGMVAMKMLDKNKDGMVSKQEFLDTMSKVWDMKAAKMQLKGGMMTPADFKEVQAYLRAGA